MNDSKLIRFLKSFTVLEIKEFEKFVNSPFFSLGRDVSAYYKLISSYYPEFENEKLAPENVFAKLYPAKKFDQKTSVNILHKLSSELFVMCKEFLIQKGLNQDNQRKKYYLLQKLREKKLYSEFDRIYKDAIDETDEIRKGGADDFLNKYFLYDCHLEYCIESGKADEAINSKISMGESAAIAALNMGYRNPDQLSNFRSGNPALNFNLIDTMIENLDSETFLRTLKKNNDKNYPYIDVNFTIYKLGINPDNHENYFHLKQQFDKYKQYFGRTEKYILLSIMASHCIRNLYGGSSDIFTVEEFEVYKKGIELNLHKYNETDSIDLGRFRNIVNSAFSLNEIEWLEKFISKHLSELSPNYRQSMKYYSMAFVFFGKGEFMQALENLNEVSYDYFLFKSDIKNLSLKIFYELGFFEQAFSLLDSVKHYISSTKDLPAPFKLRETNFIKFINELLKIKTSGNKKDVSELRKTIIEELQVNSKAWLLKKIDEAR